MSTAVPDPETMTAAEAEALRNGMAHARDMVKFHAARGDRLRKRAEHAEARAAELEAALNRRNTEGA